MMQALGQKRTFLDVFVTFSDKIGMFSDVFVMFLDEIGIIADAIGRDYCAFWGGIFKNCLLFERLKRTKVILYPINQQETLFSF